MLNRVRRLFGRHHDQRPSTRTAVMPAPPAADDRGPADDFVMPFEIRPLVAGDAAALAGVFRRAIEQTAARHYGADAIRAWAASADQPDFAERLHRGLTLVATLHGDYAGFAQLHPADHIEMLYLSPEAAGLGIATLLYQHLEDEARLAGSRRLTTHASLAARRFFESVGFQVEEEETVTRQGVPLARYRMTKTLVSAPGTGSAGAHR